MTKIDYLLVGQGITGTVLAHTLLKNGNSVVVVDDGNPYSASKAAAGIFNPITGTRIVKTWNADNLFPFLKNFYSELQKKIDVPFFFPTPIYRPFHSIEEQNYGLARVANPAMNVYLEDNVNNADYTQFLQNNYGGIGITQGGFVLTQTLLKAFKSFLEQNNFLITEKVIADDLQIQSDCITWKNIQARYVVFCDGRHAAQQSLFGWLPFAPVKGELLHLTADVANWQQSVIVSHGMYLFQQTNGNWIAGATYDKQNLDTEITENAKSELLATLQKFTKIEFEVVHQVAGIRPAVKDRKPLIGRHPDYRRIVLLNGMGTKGISLTPYYANQLVNHLEKDEPLDKEVNLNRFLR